MASPRFMFFSIMCCIVPIVILGAQRKRPAGESMAPTPKKGGIFKYLNPASKKNPGSNATEVDEEA
eukprot:288743-Prorocentrum_minimum.AAC.1